MTKINFGTELLDIRGVAPIKNADGAAVTLRDVALQALNANYQDEQHLAASEKVRRFQLAVKIANSDCLELESEDIAALKALIGKAWNPLAVGRAFEILEGKPPEGKQA